MIKYLRSMIGSLQRCRHYITGIFLIYWISCLAGMIMVHSGNEFALSQRDAIVGTALRTSEASRNYLSGDRFAAAAADCAGNFFLAAVPQTVAGLSVVIPYLSVPCQGWVGGIVSVDGAHRSRLSHIRSAAYIFIVLLLQYIPFSLAIGAGVKCGMDSYRSNRQIDWRIWKYRIPRESLADVGYALAASIPLFFLASCFEFLSTWNG